LIDLGSGFHRNIGNYLQDGAKDIGWFAIVSINFNSKIGAHPVVYKSRIARFEGCGNCRQIRKSTKDRLGKVRELVGSITKPI